MQRFLTFVGAVLVGYAMLPSLAHAQVIVQRVYAPPPVVMVQPAPAYYVAPAPSITTYRYPATYSYYPPATTYVAPASVITYSAPPVMTYAPPIAAPAPGYYQTTTSYGFGIFRPRGYTTQTYYHP